MVRRILVLQDKLVMKRNGVVLTPFVSLDELGGVPFDRRIQVELRLPDGSKRNAEAILTVPRRPEMKPPYEAAVRLPEESGEDLPAGTEVWTTA